MRPGIVHRLDKDTSGCMVAAKSQAALMSLQRQIAQRSCSRRYLGLVHGVLPQEQDAWDGPVGRHPVARRRAESRLMFRSRETLASHRKH